MAYEGTGTVNTFLQATTSGPKYSASTFTIGGNLAFSGAFATTITVTNTTSVTLPTSGTLATTAQLPSITATQFDVLVGGAANAIVSVGPGSAGQVLQSGGNASNPVYSTATYPSTATGTGTLLRADGTNWVATTSTYPNTNAVSTLLYASSSNVMAALATANSGVLTTSSSGVPSIDTTNFAVLTTGVQMKGNNTNTAPPAGFIGEQIRASSTAVSMTNTTVTNITSISLTAGIWDVSGMSIGNATGAFTAMQLGISATSATLAGTVGDQQTQFNIVATAPILPMSIPSFRVTLSSTTTYYLVGAMFFSTGTATANGRLSATRVG